MRGAFLRWGVKLLVGSAGVASSGFVVSHCATQIGGAPVPPPPAVTSADVVPTTPWNFNWDRRDPRFLKKRAWKSTESKVVEGGAGDGDEGVEWPKARRNLILVRHGQYNQSGNDDNCHTLTKLGEEQAALAGKRLKESGVKFTSIVSSGMTRAIQTAEIIAREIGQEGLKVTVKDPILNEGAPCVPEPPYKNAALWDPEYYEFYEEGARIEAAFRKYVHRAEVTQEEDSTELIVCHGNVIRFFSMRAMQFPQEAWLRLGIAHTSLTKLTLHGEGDVVMRGLGDCGHLPAKKETY